MDSSPGQNQDEGRQAITIKTGKVYGKVLPEMHNYRGNGYRARKNNIILTVDVYLCCHAVSMFI